MALNDIPNVHNRCVQDLWYAMEDTNLRVETPTTCVEQSELNSPMISYRSVSQNPFRGPSQPTVEIEFGVLCDTDKRQQFSSEMCENEPIAIYGQQHVWELSEVWEAEAWYTPNDDSAIEYAHKHRYMGVDLIGWR